MLFASTRLTLVRELGGEHFPESVLTTEADELTAAGEHWNMAAQRIPSLSDSSGLILRLGEVHRARAPR